VFPTTYDLSPTNSHFFAGLQEHLSAGFLQPEQTLFSMGLPHFLQGEQPHVWHMAFSFSRCSGFVGAGGTETGAPARTIGLPAGDSKRGIVGRATSRPDE
jgi:hypothetical protein